MKQVISWLQGIRLRQILTVFLLVITFFVSNAFGLYGNSLQAQAEPVTPEATKYQVERTDTQLPVAAQNAKEKAEDAANNLARDTKQAASDAKESTEDTGKNLFQNIREKLNLDEPLDPGTKQVLKDAGDAITGNND